MSDTSECFDNTNNRCVMKNADWARSKLANNLFERGGFEVTLYKSVPCVGIRHIIKNEVYTFNQDYVTLVGKTNIIGSSVDWSLGVYTIINNSTIVASTSGNVYTSEIDYTMNYNTGIVTRKTTGSITSGQSVKINYIWTESCVQLDTGVSDPNCPSCHGTGATYDDGIATYATRNNPSYENPYEKLGYWEIGDDMFNVSADLDVMAASVGPDGLFLRDKFLVNGEEWYVMSRPSITQFRGRLMFKNCHVRNINKINTTNKRRGDFNLPLQGGTVDGITAIDERTF